jgi:hypothetical protein
MSSSKRETYLTFGAVLYSLYRACAEDQAGAWLDPARVIGFGLEFILEIRSGQVRSGQVKPNQTKPDLIRT